MHYKLNEIKQHYSPRPFDRRRYLCALYGKAQGLWGLETCPLRRSRPQSCRAAAISVRLKKEDVLKIIDGLHKDRPNTLREFGNMIFYNPVSAALSDWVFQLGLQAASWSTEAIAYTWLDEELFEDLKRIRVPTLILHGLNDQVCLYPLALAQDELIKNSKLIPFESCGHFLFYDQREKFNRELVAFLEE